MKLNHLVKVTAIAAVLTIGVSTADAAKRKGGAPEAPKEVGKTVGKEPDMSKPAQVFILLGQSNMVGMGRIAGGEGGLEHAIKVKKLYPYLFDDESKWASRADVRYVRVMSGKKGGGMQVFNNEPMNVAKCKSIGPEFGVMHFVGDFIDAPVMILKSCIGNRSLGWDLLPPGSEPYDGQPGYRGTRDNLKGNGEKPQGWYAGKQYDDDVEYAKTVLSDLNTYYPGAKNYEVAGFFFWQGEKDTGSATHAAHYEENLVRFIKALRKDFNAPHAKFVLGTLGEAKKGSGGNGGKILEAHLAVDGDSGKHPDFKGNVKTVYTHPLSKGGSGNGHYGSNSETYMNVGEGMGQAMVELLKNK